MKSTKQLVLPGFDGMPLYDVASFFFHGLWQGSITTRASALSFKFFLALFPAIIFFFTLIPYIPISGFQETLLTMLQNILPKQAYVVAIETLKDIITQEHGSLLSLGFLATLYFSTSGIHGMMDAFNDSIHVKETRSFLKQKLFAVIMVLILSILIILAITLIISGSWLLDYLVREHILESVFTINTLLITKWVIIIALFFFMISFLYYLAPAKRERYRFISAGSTLATLLFIVTSVGFNYYISNFSQYNKLYGSIGTLIIILMWIYINSIVLLIGFGLNVSIMNAGKLKKRK
ncbi:MAG: YihY/virulence factor BrkB family protein [Bacteroidota bacterium]